MKTDNPSLRPAIATLIALACLLAGAAMLLGWLPIDRPLPSLGQAVSAEATIVANRVQPGEWSRGKFPQKAADRYFVRVNFVAGDVAQSAEIQVGQAYYNANLPSAHVTVWYFPDRPQVAVLDRPGELTQTGSRFGLLFGWLLVGVGVWCGVISANKLYVARGGQSVL